MNIGGSVLSLRIQNSMERINSTIIKQNEKLSSGIRINRASDDAAGLKISEKMRAQVRGLDMSVDNATDGISMLQTAEGGLSEITDLLQRMNELSIKAVNGVHTEDDLIKISQEYEQCKEEIDRITETTTFNGKQLLNLTTGETKRKELLRTTGIGNIMSARAIDEIDFSTLGAGNRFIIKKGDEEYKFEFCYQKNPEALPDSIKINFTGEETNIEKAEKLRAAIEKNVSGLRVEVYPSTPDDGKNYTLTIISRDKIEGEILELNMENNAPVIKVGNNKDDEICLNLQSVTTKELGIDETSVLTSKDAENATKKISNAINQISAVRGKMGATQSRLEYTIKRLSIEKENTAAAESRIRDVDMAKEMVSNAKNKIIYQSSVSMLAQANQSSAMVLNLLKN